MLPRSILSVASLLTHVLAIPACFLVSVFIYRSSWTVAYLDMGVHCEPDVSTSTLRSEIMILSVDRKELSTTLSSICGVTRGKILVSMVENRNCEYIQSRVAKATNVVCVEQKEEDGKLVSRLTYSERFPNHMKSAVNDIFKSIGSIETAE